MANLSISPDVVREAKEIGIKVSAFCEGKLREETRRRRAEQWNRQNAAFLAEYSALIEKDGPALAEFRTF